MNWNLISVPHDAAPPAPLTVRAQTIPARTSFVEHAHQWGQVVHAISGALAVRLTDQSFVISPDEAVWLPIAINHRVGSLLGAEFRSLWIAADRACALSPRPFLFTVTPFLRALIEEAEELNGRRAPQDYGARVTDLIFDQLMSARPIAASLPWPRSEPICRLCEALYADPSDQRSVTDWGRILGMSSRTLTRRFTAELGMNLRYWRMLMRTHKAIEFLGGGMHVTQAALELGYGSSSAFTYAFRTATGVSPSRHKQVRAGKG